MKQKDDPIKENSKLYIAFFKALANEERLQIIQLLKKNKEMFAQDVERHFFLEQSTTSHHLNILRRAGITNARKEGRKVFYSLNESVLLDTFVRFSELFKSAES